MSYVVVQRRSVGLGSEPSDPTDCKPGEYFRVPADPGIPRYCSKDCPSSWEGYEWAGGMLSCLEPAIEPVEPGAGQTTPSPTTAPSPAAAAQPVPAGQAAAATAGGIGAGAVVVALIALALIW